MRSARFEQPAAQATSAMTWPQPQSLLVLVTGVPQFHRDRAVRLVVPLRVNNMYEIGRVLALLPAACHLLENPFLGWEGEPGLLLDVPALQLARLRTFQPG